VNTKKIESFELIYQLDCISLEVKSV